MTHHVLVWYFAKLSGECTLWSNGRPIVVLLTLEGAALILLFGGEVIADIDAPESDERVRGRCQVPVT